MEELILSNSISYDVLLDEFVHLIPFNLSPIGIIDGTKIKSNERIENHVLNVLSSDKSISKIYKKIMEGMDKQIILIGYEDGGLFNFIGTRWRDFNHRDPKKGYAGYISVVDKQIAIVLDENVNLFGNVMRDLGPYLIHELTHLCSVMEWKTFMDINLKSVLIPFYKSIFNGISKNLRTLEEEDISDAIIKVSKLNDSNFTHQPNVIGTFNIWKKLFLTVTDPKNADLYLSLFYLPFRVITQNSSVSEPGMKKVYLNLLHLYEKTYDDMGVKNLLSFTTPGQEMIFPSEIICIFNSVNLNSGNIKLINSLKFKEQ
jgi:hypothetical protein